MNSNLLQQLSDQEKNLNDLLDAAKQQQRALIENNLSGMHLAVAREEALLKHMNECQQRTIEAITEFADLKGFKLKAKKVSELLAQMDKKDEYFASWSEAVDRLRIISNKVSRINFQNKLLITQSRSFIKDTISELTDKGGKKILDKRM